MGFLIKFFSRVFNAPCEFNCLSQICPSNLNRGFNSSRVLLYPNWCGAQDNNFPFLGIYECRIENSSGVMKRNRYRSRITSRQLVLSLTPLQASMIFGNSITHPGIQNYSNATARFRLSSFTAILIHSSGGSSSLPTR